MEKEPDIEWQKIEKEIYTAFKDVKLEDGIGFHEANARDSYLQPDNPEYQLEKEKDERGDWTKLLINIPPAEMSNDRHCFMDAEGLRFYLPFLMLRKDEAVNSLLYSYISEYYNRYGYQKSEFTKTVALLTSKQKRSIYHFYEYMTKIPGSNFYEEHISSTFDTGEEALKGFSFMEFLKKQFDIFD